jgi:anthranilate synthase/aminodeoxychorismate synthase-like glutamine amidotransferase
MRLKKVLVIDNVDSFVYNLAQYLGEFGMSVDVRRNNKVGLEEVKALEPDMIVLSPGPGRPGDSKVTLDILRDVSREVPTLGVCLGHEAVAEIYGGKVVMAGRGLMHGKTSEVFHSEEGIFNRIPSPFRATRYHSLLVERRSLPECLEITAETRDGEIMGIQHKEYPIYGVQFHPESILTEHGRALLENFIEVSEGR